uniref:Uncharacterized protein n=1 Tax=Parascaris univalens TaxID=6257 RepID=A0A915AAC1_PARUN
HSVCSLSSGRLLEMTGIIGLLVALVIIGTSFYIYRHYVLFPPAKIPERDEIIDPLASTVTANPLHSTTDANATAKVIFTLSISQNRYVDQLTSSS